MTDKQRNILISIAVIVLTIASLVAPIATYVDLSSQIGEISHNLNKIVAILIDKDIIEYSDYYSSLCCPWTGDTV